MGHQRQGLGENAKEDSSKEAHRDQESSHGDNPAAQSATSPKLVKTRSVQASIRELTMMAHAL